jgi:hypothetical protein
MPVLLACSLALQLKVQRLQEHSMRQDDLLGGLVLCGCGCLDKTMSSSRRRSRSSSRHTCTSNSIKHAAVAVAANSDFRGGKTVHLGGAVSQARTLSITKQWCRPCHALYLAGLCLRCLWACRGASASKSCSLLGKVPHWQAHSCRLRTF